MRNCRSTQNVYRGAQINNSRSWLTDCVFDYNLAGVEIGGGSHGITNCTFDHNTHSGLGVSNATVSAYGDSKARNNDIWGCIVSRHGSIGFSGTGDFSNNVQNGMHVIRGGYVKFNPGYSGQMNGNGQYGLYARYNGFTEGHTLNTFSGNTLGDTYTNDGGALY
ncbi:hypothetical protein JXA32_11110 [Candidatus Sumerlaeota bacterium]|nr:hypothetical protein [Candidatus Sumerlaeota bacterium]